MSRSSPQRMLYCSVCKKEYNKTYLWPWHEHHPEVYQAIEILGKSGHSVQCKCLRCGREYLSRAKEAYKRLQWKEYIDQKNDL